MPKPVYPDDKQPYDARREFPAHFQNLLRTGAGGQYQSSHSDSPVQSLKKDVEAYMRLLILNLQLPYVDQNNKIQKKSFFKALIERLDAEVEGKDVKLDVYLGGGVVRSLLAYTYLQVHRDYQAFMEYCSKKLGRSFINPEPTLERTHFLMDQEVSSIDFLVEDLLFQAVRATGLKRIIHTMEEDQRPLESTEVLGIGSDLDVFIEITPSNPTLEKALKDIATSFINSAESQVDLLQERWTLKHNLVPVGDVKVRSDQLTRTQEQGGSSLDWLSFDLRKGTLSEPMDSKDEESILNDFFEGFLGYEKPKDSSEDPSDKQVIRAYRALLEIPSLMLKDDAKQRLISDLNSVHKKKSLSEDAKKQIEKLIRNANENGANNRAFRDDLFEILLKVAYENGIKFPRFLAGGRSLDVSVKPDGKHTKAVDSLLIENQYFSKIFLPGQTLYHGTDLSDLPFLIRNGFYISDQDQGSSMYGSGVYVSQDPNVAGQYGDVLLRVELESDKTLRILDLRLIQGALKENLETESLNLYEVVDLNRLLRDRYCIDLVLATDKIWIVQNAKVLKNNLNLEQLMRAYFEKNIPPLEPIFKGDNTINNDQAKGLRVCFNLAKLHDILCADSKDLDDIKQKVNVLRQGFLERSQEEIKAIFNIDPLDAAKAKQKIDIYLEIEPNPGEFFNLIERIENKDHFLFLFDRVLVRKKDSFINTFFCFLDKMSTEKLNWLTVDSQTIKIKKRFFTKIIFFIKDPSFGVLQKKYCIKFLMQELKGPVTNSFFEKFLEYKKSLDHVWDALPDDEKYTLSFSGVLQVVFQEDLQNKIKNIKSILDRGVDKYISTKEEKKIVFELIMDEVMKLSALERPQTEHSLSAYIRGMSGENDFFPVQERFLSFYEKELKELFGNKKNLEGDVLENKLNVYFSLRPDKEFIFRCFKEQEFPKKFLLDFLFRKEKVFFRQFLCRIFSSVSENDFYALLDLQGLFVDGVQSVLEGIVEDKFIEERQRKTIFIFLRDQVYFKQSKTFLSDLIKSKKLFDSLDTFFSEEERERFSSISFFIERLKIVLGQVTSEKSRLLNDIFRSNFFSTSLHDLQEAFKSNEIDQMADFIFSVVIDLKQQLVYFKQIDEGVFNFILGSKLDPKKREFFLNSLIEIFKFEENFSFLSRLISDSNLEPNEKKHIFIALLEHAKSSDPSSDEIFILKRLYDKLESSFSSQEAVDLSIYPFIVKKVSFICELNSLVQKERELNYFLRKYNDFKKIVPKKDEENFFDRLLSILKNIKGESFLRDHSALFDDPAFIKHIQLKMYRTLRALNESSNNFDEALELFQTIFLVYGKKLKLFQNTNGIPFLVSTESSDASLHLKPHSMSSMSHSSALIFSSAPASSEYPIITAQVLILGLKKAFESLSQEGSQDVWEEKRTQLIIALQRFIRVVDDEVIVQEVHSIFSTILREIQTADRKVPSKTGRP